MQTAVIFLGETAKMQQSHRKRIAHDQSRGGTGGRREVERTGFARDFDRHMQIGKFRQGRLGISGETGHFHAETFRRKNHTQEFIAFPAVADRQHQVAFADHAQIAVHRLDRMHEDRGRTRARQRGRDLFADMPAFADPADHDLAVFAEYLQTKFDQPGERSVQMVAHIFQTFDLGPYGFQAFFDNFFGIHDNVSFPNSSDNASI